MKVCILGNGSWGTALAQVLLDNKNEVSLFGIEQTIIDDINNNHRNSLYFPDVELTKKMTSTSNLEEAIKDSKIILLAVPSHVIESITNQIKPFINDEIILINVAKGFNPKDNNRMSDTIRHATTYWQYRPSIVSLIGPSHAEEVVKRQLTLVTATSLDLDKAKIVQKLFANEYFRVYTNTDEIGAEFGAAIKNTIAIAAGCIIGLGYGDNTKAALVTRGLVEITRLGMAYGGKQETFAGLTGLGDLLVTCNSLHSRNFKAGYAIGQKDSAKEFLETNKTTVEGIRTSLVIHHLSKEKNIEMPICEAVYQVLYENKKPSELVKLLMTRDLKTEGI